MNILSLMVLDDVGGRLNGIGVVSLTLGRVVGETTTPPPAYPSYRLNGVRVARYSWKMGSPWTLPNMNAVERLRRLTSEESGCGGSVRFYQSFPVRLQLHKSNRY
jgi:hypothetical protein